MSLEQLLTTDPEFRQLQPACSDGTGQLTALFFSDELCDIASAKRVCETCPLMADCLEGALERRERWGVWGGQLLANGRIVMAKRGRGRPPKHPKPDQQLLQVALPERLAHLEPQPA